MGSLTWNLVVIVLFAALARLPETRGIETYQMDVDATDNICGHSVELPPNIAARIVSAGKTSNGYCSLLFYLMSNDTHKCDAICVSMNKSWVGVCTAKVVFTGIHFASTDKSVHKELSCWHRSSEPICLHSKVMRVEIIEKHHYAFHSPKRSYEFDGTVYPKCHKLGPGETFNIDVSKQVQEGEVKEKEAYVYGIIVALCLASVFLILLLITYCYYKMTGTRNRRDIPMPRIKKAITFSGMRNKLSFSRLHSSSSSKSPKSPTNKNKDKFKFEEEKHENDPLVVANVTDAAATAVALEEQLEPEPSTKPSATVVVVEPTISAN